MSGLLLMCLDAKAWELIQTLSRIYPRYQTKRIAQSFWNSVLLHIVSKRRREFAERSILI